MHDDEGMKIWGGETALNRTKKHRPDGGARELYCKEEEPWSNGQVRIGTWKWQHQVALYRAILRTSVPGETNLSGSILSLSWREWAYQLSTSNTKLSRN